MAMTRTTTLARCNMCVCGTEVKLSARTKKSTASHSQAWARAQSLITSRLRSTSTTVLNSCDDAHSHLGTWVGRLGRRENTALSRFLPRWLAPSSSAKGGAASSEKDLHERPKDPKERKKSSLLVIPHRSSPCKLRDARQLDLESGVCLDFLCSFPSCSTRGCVVVVVDAATPRGPGGETSPRSTVGSSPDDERE